MVAPAQPQDDNSCSCRFCGGDAARWQERSGISVGADDDAEERRAPTPVCVLCDLAQRLDNPEIDREAALIWLPELSQAALNILVRGVHLTLFKHRISLFADYAALSSTTPGRAAVAAYEALRERRAAARRLLGTNSPSELGEVLLRLSPGSYARRGDLLAGTRLLPLGQLFVDGRDVYPKLLAEWTRAHGGETTSAKQHRQEPSC